MELNPWLEAHMPDKKEFRIFVSSPGDVVPERKIALRVCERLNREFAYHFTIKAVLWEREPLLATEHFQTMITPPSQSDVVVVILWSRLGSPLPEDRFRGAVSGEIVTGTEWEFEDAVDAYQKNGIPDLLLYKKTEEVLASLENEEELERKRGQRQKVENFMGRWFMNKDTGTFRAASHFFTSATQFEEMLEIHLRELFLKRLEISNDGVIPTGISWHKGSPFRGLESFDIEHAPVFFGRTRARNELRELIGRQDTLGRVFLIILGASGSGKSSLVKAGLLPDLVLPGMVNRIGLCRHGTMRPSDSPSPENPETTLAMTMLSRSALPELTDLHYDAAALAGLLKKRDPQILSPVIRSALVKAGESARLTEHAQSRLVLFVDQFEELFIDKRISKSDREAFIDALDALSRTGMVWILSAMRSDFFHLLETVPALAESMKNEGSRYHLTPPTDAEIAQIICQPAREAGLRFEVNPNDGISLDETLRKIACANPNSLPLLEFTLDQLWHSRTKNGLLTYQAYSRLGGMEGALSRKAEEIFTAQDEDTQKALPHVLRALATIDGDGESGFTARTVHKSFFRKGSPELKLIEAMLASDARLLLADGDGEGARLRIAHEALLTHWERARTQLEQDQRYQRIRVKIEQSAAHWRSVSEQHKESLLLRSGLPLSEAEDLLNRWRQDLSGEVIDYIESSLRYTQRQQEEKERRSKRIVRISTIAAALMFVLSALAVTSQQKAKEQSRIAGQRLGEKRREVIKSDHHLGLAMQIQANHALKNRDLNGAHLYTLYSLLKLRPFSKEEAMALSRLYSQKMIQLEKSLPASHPFGSYETEVSCVRYSPNGRLVAVALRNGRIRIYDLSTGQYTDLSGHTEAVAGIDFSPDGMHLISSSSDGTIRIWNIEILASRVISRVCFQHYAYESTKDIDMHEPIGGLSFSADGRYFAHLCNEWGAQTYIWPPRTVHERPYAYHAAKFIVRVVNAKSGKLRWCWEDTKFPLTAVVFAPRGDELAVGAYDGTVRLFDTGSGKSRTITKHAGPITGLAFSRDNNLLASASDDKTIHVWNREAGRKRILEGHAGGVKSIAIGPNGRKLVSGAADRTIRFWDIETGKSSVWDGHTDVITSVAFSPDGRQVASGSYDRTLSLWDVASGKALVSVQGHADRITSIEFSPDDARLVSASYDHTIRLWDIASGKSQLLGRHADKINCVRFSPDGQRIASASDDKTVKIWDPDSGGTESLERHSAPVKCLAFGRDGHLLVSGSEDKQVYLRVLGDPDSNKALTGHTDTVNCVDVSPDDRFIASGSADKTVRLWEIRTGKIHRMYQMKEPVLTLAFSHSGAFLACGLSDGKTMLLDVKSGKQRVLEGNASPVRHIDFCPDNLRFASAHQDGIVRLWNLKGEDFNALRGHTGAVYSVSFSHDGELLASASEDRTIRVWRLREEGVVRELEGFEGSVRNLADSSYPSVLADFPSVLQIVTDDGTIRVWNSETGGRKIVARIPDMHPDKVHTLNYDFPNKKLVYATKGNDIQYVNFREGYRNKLKGSKERITSLACSDGEDLMPEIAAGFENGMIRVWRWEMTGHTLTGHKGKVNSLLFMGNHHLVSGSADKTVRIWDLKTGKSYPLTGHKGAVLCLALSKDGDLASGSADNTVRIWDLKSKGSRTLMGHTAPVTVLSFSEDGRSLASGSSAGSIRLWDPKKSASREIAKREGGISALVFSSNKQFLFSSGNKDPKVCIYPVGYMETDTAARRRFIENRIHRFQIRNRMSLHILDIDDVTDLFRKKTASSTESRQ